MSSARWFYYGAITSITALIALCVLWELVLAPLRPGGSWLVLKVLPLLIPLRGILKRDIYTMQWSSMLILLYVAEGAVRAVSDAGTVSSTLGYVELALSLLFFVSIVLYLRPYKQHAKTLASEAIKKASQTNLHH